MQIADLMFAVSAKAKRLGAAFTLALGSIPLASVGMAPTQKTTAVPADPSLLAAPEYRPDIWNDVSNENLAAFYVRHTQLIENVINQSRKNSKDKLAFNYPRQAHAKREKALYVIRRFDEIFSGGKNAQYMLSFAVEYKVPAYEISTALHDVKKILRPLGVQSANNCYAYAVNDRDHTTLYQAAPGERTMGSEAYKVDSSLRENYKAMVLQTINGNVSDGMIFTGKKMESREGFYRAALYVKPAKENADSPYEGTDYHYIRQNRDGTWSHKYGAMNVNNLDYSNKLIIDPAKADMADYIFIGYFLVPKDGLDVGPANEKSTKPDSPPPFDGPA